MNEKLTKKRIAELCRQARRHGYFQRSVDAGYVFCPLCRAEVAAPRYIDYQAKRPRGDCYESWPIALDRAMRDHLNPANEECKGS